MDYTNQTSLEAYLKRSLSTEEIGYLPYAIQTAKAIIDDYVGGAFGVTVETSRLYSGGKKYLQIDPAVSISKVELVDTLGITIYEYTNNSEISEFQIEPDSQPVKLWIVRRLHKFPVGLNNIKVTGLFGLSTTIPYNITNVANMLVGNMMADEQVQGLKRESIEGYSREWIGTNAVLDTAKNMLSKYIDDEIYI